MGELDGDRPGQSVEADVTLVARGITVTAAVHESSTHLLVLKPLLGTVPRDTTVKVGDAVEVFWVRGDEERMLSGSVSEVETGRSPRWYLSVNGPSERSKRRRTVRARVELPVRIPWAGGEMVGQTQDLSESGTLVLVDGWGLPPEAGNPLTVSLNLGSSHLDIRGEVLRQQSRAVQWLLAIRFTNTSESVQDRLRARVFQALREERARANR
jgi:PilZ domain-containing protein